MATERLLKCCGGTTDGTTTSHKENCPSVVRAALSWIEESSTGERHRKRGLAAFEAILGERDQLQEALENIAKGARRAVEWADEHERSVTRAEVLMLADWADRALATGRLEAAGPESSKEAS
jgi:hypothetical protein